MYRARLRFPVDKNFERELEKNDSLIAGYFFVLRRGGELIPGVLVAAIESAASL
jgi:hypothetical protein